MHDCFVLHFFNVLSNFFNAYMVSLWFEACDVPSFCGRICWSMLNVVSAESDVVATLPRHLLLLSRTPHDHRQLL